MITVSTRDINQVLRLNTGEIELRCALYILNISSKSKSVCLNINKELGEFSGAQVHYVMRVLILLGLITYKKEKHKIRINCINLKNVKSILQNKETLSDKCEVKSLHKLITISQCEAIEVLQDYVDVESRMVNIRKICRENYFAVRIVRVLLKYLKIANVIECESYGNYGSKIRVINQQAFNYIVKKGVQRLGGVE